METTNTTSHSINYDLHKRLLDHLTTAVLLLDESLRVIYANPASEQLMAASLSQLKGTSIQQLIRDQESSAHSDIEQALKELNPFTKREARVYIANNADAMTVDYTFTPILTDTKTSLLVEIRPLDRLLRISREDGLMNAHLATRALVRGVAHEVKNPLGGIRGAAQLLSRELPDESLAEYTNIIIAEVDRLRTLVDQMLGPRKLPKPASVNIHEILERVRAILLAESENQVEIIRDYDPSLPEIWGDKDQLIQATLNIARNAKQALSENQNQENPIITLRTRALRQFTIGHNRHRLIILLEIQDNGPGIDKELKDTMFYPLVSGRASGTGLGLSLSQDIVNQHHGLIECESQPGNTIFRLLLPLEPPEVPNHVGA